MSVTPVEVESISPPTGSAKPKPTYTDGNITVYSIPLFPKVGGDAHPQLQEDSSSKRKRRASSASPPRRSTDAGFSAESENLPLEERMRLNGFLPTNLVGREAQQWREMTIKNMFPAKSSKSGKGADAGVDADPPYVSALRRHPGSFNPAGSDKQLPMMNFTKDSELITSKQKPSLAYIVVGPKTRGKFDAKKADELGLEGRLRGVLANGTAVTFTTTDTQGKKIERTVKPEECVGPGDNPAVCTGFARLFLFRNSLPRSPLGCNRPRHPHCSAYTSCRFGIRRIGFLRQIQVEKSRRPGRVSDKCCLSSLWTRRYRRLKVSSVHARIQLQRQRVSAFLSSFSWSHPEVLFFLQHIVASRKHCPDPVTFTNAAFNQLQFNRLDPDLFPIPQFSLKAHRPLENLVDKFDFESGMGSAEPKLPPKTYVMTAGMNTGVRPILPPKVWDSEEKFHPAATELAAIHEANMAKRPVGRSTPTQEIVVEKKVDVKGIEFDKKILSLAAFKKFEEARAVAKVTPAGVGAGPGLPNGGNIKVIPLGTSSALPSKYRNGMHPCFPRVKSLTRTNPIILVSGYLIRIPKHGSILLEAGEGTWGQMCRFFGTDPKKPNNVWEVLRDIKVIFVSHAHGDHHFGLSKILSIRKQVRPELTILLI